jgi:hypothetical protein
MDLRARTVSKFVNNALFDFYSHGAMRKHTFSTGEGDQREYTSTGDVEAVLAPVNNIQDRE